jgi:hypothetical protein
MALVAVWRLDVYDGISFKKTLIKAALIMSVTKRRLALAASGLNLQTSTFAWAESSL